jgi:hypothetical protein
MHNPAITTTTKKRKKKKIMYEGFINEHHLFEDVMPVVKLGGSSLLFPQVCFIGEGGQSGL